MTLADYHLTDAHIGTILLDEALIGECESTPTRDSLSSYSGSGTETGLGKPGRSPGGVAIFWPTKSKSIA